jgi:4-amino-4-deoxy-L-arabinose transferase-like glycosyltransferase
MQVVPRSPRASPFLESRAALALILVVSAAVFALVSQRPLTHSEFRYVEAGAEMAAGGDWVVPHLAYVPYFEKPILAYWVEAAALLAFGTGVIAVRLQAILSCVGMLYLTYALGRSVRGRAFGVGAAALLLSSVYFTGMGSAVTTDPLFSALLVLAWYAFRRHDVDPTGRWIWLFWTAVGLAVLTKGPLAIVFVGLSIGAYLALSGRLRDVKATRPWRGAAVLLAINLPWSLLVWARDPRFLEFFYVRQNFQAFFNGRINHPGPPWYYVSWLLLAMFPFVLLGAWALGSELWTTFAAAARRRFGSAAESPDPARLYVACMLLPPLLFLSVSSSKLGTYFLPLVPAVALLFAGWIADRLERPTGFVRWALLVQTAVLAVGLPIAMHLMTSRPELADKIVEHRVVFGCAVAMMAVGFGVGGVAMARRRIVLGMAVASAATTAGVLCALPAIDVLATEYDAAVLMPRLIAARGPGERVILAGPCSEDFSVVLALGERVAIWGASRELGMGHFAEVTPPSTPIPADPYDVGGPKLPLPANPWLFDDARLAAAWNGAERAWFVGKESDLERLRATGLCAHVFVANDSRVIATNQPPPAER